MTPAKKNAFALVALDTFSLLAVFNLIAWLWLERIGSIDSLLILPLIVPLVGLGLALLLIDGYRLHNDMLSLDYTSQHSIALVGTMLVTLLFTYVVIPAGYTFQQSRAVIALSYLALIPITLSYRRLLFLRFIRHHGAHFILFLGDQASRQNFKAEFQQANMRQKLIFLTSDEIPHDDATGEHLLPLASALADVATGKLSTEAIVLRESNQELPAAISHQLTQLHFQGIPTYTLERFHQMYWRKIPLYRLNQTWLFQEGFEVAREPAYDRLKRASDIALSVIGLVVFSLPLFAAALAIKLTSPGPVLFRQTRVGRFQKTFQVFKLRSMRVEQETTHPYAREGDKRITPLGRFLRSSRLDEVPQLLNVLRGEMSLIGPRAEWDRLVADYERAIPCYHFRHLVRPGITGWAQINYPYGANLEDTLRKLEYDLYYIRHFSFTMDASIVLKTIHVMLFGKGR